MKVGASAHACDRFHELQSALWGNMRYLTFAVVFVALGAALYLNGQLTSAREQLRQATLREQSLHDEISRLKQSQATTETDLRAAHRAPSHAFPAPSDVPQTAAPTTQNRAPLAASWPKIPALDDGQRMLLVRRRYRRVFRDLALSAAEVEALLPILARQDQHALEARPEDTDPSPDDGRDEAELEAVLGPEKASRLSAERELLPARQELNLLRMRMDESGEPLSPEQQADLLAALRDLPREAPRRRVEGEDPQQAMERANAWLREREQRLQNAAMPVLTPSQRQVLEEDAKFREAMRVSTQPHAIAASPSTAGSFAPPVER